MTRNHWLLSLLLSLLAVASPCLAEDLLPKCQSALSACDTLVKAQEDQITGLKAEVKEWKKQAESPLEGPPITLLAALSGAAGGAVVGEVRGTSALGGAAIGGAVGAVIGFIVSEVSK